MKRQRSGPTCPSIGTRLHQSLTDPELEGHYHGCMDSALLSYMPQQADVGLLYKPKTVRGSKGQVSNSEENTLVAPWNRLEIVEQILEAHNGQIAAITMEAVLCNSGCLMPLPGYLQSVRELATKHGCLLMLDEVITGFRIDPGERKPISASPRIWQRSEKQSEEASR